MERTLKGADVVRVLGVLFTPDLALDRHVTTVSAKCFFHLRQLRRVRRSLDRESTATLVHAFVTSRSLCVVFFVRKSNRPIHQGLATHTYTCLLYTSPSPRD